MLEKNKSKHALKFAFAFEFIINKFAQQLNKIEFLLRLLRISRSAEVNEKIVTVQLTVIKDQISAASDWIEV